MLMLVRVNSFSYIIFAVKRKRTTPVTNPTVVAVIAGASSSAIASHSSQLIVGNAGAGYIYFFVGAKPWFFASYHSRLMATMPTYLGR